MHSNQKSISIYYSTSDAGSQYCCRRVGKVKWRWKDGRTDGRTDGWMDGQTDRQTNKAGCGIA